MFDSFNTNLFNIGGYENNILNNLIALKILLDKFILNIFYL